ncbi:MFS transporter [Thioalkalivibrio denitrificans]|uniref:MFS transporter n=1 Tax=Thioalkalivibrio denitrificans TaxID=108003 RepID=A0A1V3NC56_9GAMM|nr:MFS transporter [Thioalkalivibrio denitrificans]OOG22660.1 MFS transporter [Thioalkalivibrio denitrificans]
MQETVRTSPAIEMAYQALVDDEDARVCKDISDDACRVVPGNFFLQILAQFFTKLADALANPKTVLAWLLTALGAPGIFTALLVPIRESGSLIPQLVIASYVRLQRIRKWTFVLGSVLEALALFAMVVIAATLTGTTAGVALIAALVMFSLARGLCSVASKDVLGKTVPKTRRGRVGGWSEFAAGIVTIGVGIVLMVDPAGTDNTFTYLLPFAAAGGLWLLAAGTYALIREYPGVTEGGGNALIETVQRLDRLRRDAPFRHFVIARALLLSSALSAPFVIMLAHEQTEGALLVLGLFVLADGIAHVVAGPFWGRFADVSSRRVMIVAGAAASASAAALAAVATFIPALAAAAWIYPAFFFLLSVAHSGIRLGRKTYIVDLAGGNRRTDYVSVSNTVIGIVLLLAGSVGALTAVMPVAGVIAILAAIGFVGAIWSVMLPEVTG